MKPGGVIHKAYLRLSSTRPRPSNEAHAVLRELYGTQILSSMLSGRSIGRKESVWGQMGLMRMAGISGWTREPPAESFHMISIFEFKTTKLISPNMQLTQSEWRHTAHPLVQWSCDVRHLYHRSQNKAHRRKLCTNQRVPTN